MAECGGEFPRWARYIDENGRACDAILSASRLHDMPLRGGAGQIQDQLADWLPGTVGRVKQAIASLLPEDESPARPITAARQWLAPLTSQEVWGVGVSYRRSREARQEEAQDGGDVYARVYAAQRPELFYKGNARNVVGHGGEVGIRADSDWDVPEPELAVLFNPALEVVGFTIGLDMSSRSIEGENPLYLPQAKVYNASCALGPHITLMSAEEWPFFRISMSIERDERAVFQGTTDTDQLARRLPELADYLGRSNDFPQGVFLLTGTGIVPPADFTLQSGDLVRAEISGLGAMENRVVIV